MDANGKIPLMSADSRQITKYQQLYTKVREYVEQTERDNFCLSDICNVVEESDRLLQPSSKEWAHVDPRLVLLDAKILNDASKAYKMTAEALDVDSHKFDTLDFVHNVRSHVAGERAGWASLESPSQGCQLPPPPPLVYMYAALTYTENTDKTRPRKAMRTANVVGKVVQPTKVITFEEEDVSIQTVLEQMTRVLVRRFRAAGDRPVSYLRFTVDPHSFPRTVQNMFHVAFLVRDGLAALHQDKRGLPVLTPVTKNSRNRKAAKVRQLVSTITVPQWENLIKTFRIREPMLVPLEAAGAGKSSGC